MKKQKQRSENGARKTDRTSIILSMFREFPNNKFSLKHLAFLFLKEALER